MLFEICIASENLKNTCFVQGVFEKKLGDTLFIQSSDRQILQVGCGPAADFSSSSYKKALNAMASVLAKANFMEIICDLPRLVLTDHHDYYWKIRQAVGIVRDAVYQFTVCKSRPELAPVLQKVVFLSVSPLDIKQGQHAIHHGQAIADSIDWAKNLGNLPANICTPSYVADQAKQFAMQYSDVIETHILEEADMEKLGMGALLSVARGTREPAKLIITHYQGANKATKPIIFVGKGVTFDSGGVSLKHGAAMDEMKFDMCGAASVLSVIKAAVMLNLPLNIIGIMPMTENMPGGQATKPGDIVTSLSGQTIEILNTDAEGRLILSDALTYAERFDPDVVIDIATLTGAIVTTLGAAASGIMGNDQPLIDDLIAMGEYAGDRAWQLPLWDDYNELLKSNFADIPNISEGSGAKSITAACFLAHFTKNMRWAHLDIAGTAWKTGKEKGATGRPIPLLVQYLLNRSR
ncbi:MAG: leucyl aminopeptidase [Gammaproteobacteria bacterium]